MRTLTTDGAAPLLARRQSRQPARKPQDGSRWITSLPQGARCAKVRPPQQEEKHCHFYSPLPYPTAQRKKKASLLFPMYIYFVSSFHYFVCFVFQVGKIHVRGYVCSACSIRHVKPCCCALYVTWTFVLLPNVSERERFWDFDLIMNLWLTCSWFPVLSVTPAKLENLFVGTLNQK